MTVNEDSFSDCKHKPALPFGQFDLFVKRLRERGEIREFWKGEVVLGCGGVSF